MFYSIHSGMIVMARVLNPAVPLLVLYFNLKVFDPDVSPVRNTVLARLIAWLVYWTLPYAPFASDAECVVVPLWLITSKLM
jgi:hypothetical protein